MEGERAKESETKGKERSEQGRRVREFLQKMDRERREGKEGEKDVKDEETVRMIARKKQTGRGDGLWKCLGQLTPESQSGACLNLRFLLSVFPSNRQVLTNT